MYTSVFLSEIKRQALRKRVWWSALDGLERSILSVAARIIDDVKSALLNVQLVGIIAKIREASLGRLASKTRDFGEHRAREISLLSIGLGSRVAGAWVDYSFARYLAFMSLNASIEWSI